MASSSSVDTDADDDDNGDDDVVDDDSGDAIESPESDRTSFSR